MTQISYIPVASVIWQIWFEADHLIVAGTGIDCTFFVSEMKIKYFSKLVVLVL